MNRQVHAGTNARRHAAGRESRKEAIRRMARLEGFEPPTNGFGSRYSIRLSYRRVDAINLAVAHSRMNAAVCAASDRTWYPTLPRW